MAYIEKININNGGVVAIRDAAALHPSSDETITGTFNFLSGMNIGNNSIIINTDQEIECSGATWVFDSIRVKTGSTQSSNTQTLTESENEYKQDYSDNIVYFIIED